MTKQVKRILVNHHSTGVKLEAQKSRDWDEEHYFTLVVSAWLLVTNPCRVQAPWAGQCLGPGWRPPRPHLLLSHGAPLLSRARDIQRRPSHTSLVCY